MTRTRPRRPACRRTGLVAATALLAALLASCGGTSSGALGHEACLEVSTSLRYYAAAQRATSAGFAATDRARAVNALHHALQPAALAASSDGQWQALEATLSESSRVPESELVTALSAQCAQTLAGGG